MTEKKKPAYKKGKHLPSPVDKDRALLSKDAPSPPAKKGKAGRPLKAVNAEKVYELALIHLTAAEIASTLDTAESVIWARFSDSLRKGWDEGQASLKRKMHHKALDGNGDSNMLIWLSKQRLGYRDKPADEAISTVFNIQVNQVPK